MLNVSISFCPWTQWETYQPSAEETKQLNRVKGLFPEALVSTAPLDGRVLTGETPYCR